MKLYEITNEIVVIDNLLEEEQITEETALQLMEQTEKLLAEKSQGIVQYVRVTESNINSLDVEIKRLQELKKFESNKLENFKKYVVQGMQRCKYDTLQSPIGKLSLRKSESVEIIDGMKLEQQYLREKISYEPNKVKIKDDIKNGCIVDGAELKTNYNLQIR